MHNKFGFINLTYCTECLKHSMQTKRCLQYDHLFSNDLTQTAKWPVIFYTYSHWIKLTPIFYLLTTKIEESCFVPCPRM